MNRESLITIMEVSDADVVKAANSAFSLVRRCCRTTTGLISSQTACRVEQGGSLVKTTTLSKDFETKSLVDSTTARLRGREQSTVDTALVCSTPE